MATRVATLAFTSFCVISIAIVQSLESPRFTHPIANITVPVGREAILACLVENLNPYKVAWLRVDTQTILTIHNHIITKNHRIAVTHSEFKTWYLHIKDIKEKDRGWYMCQINTDPMKSQVGYLDVVVPPDILDHPTSADILVDEGSDVSLRCAATGFPEPSIIWKREDGQLIHLGNGTEVPSTTGSNLNISKVNREHMGAYLCIASNGIPPSVSKRISLLVQFAPTVWIQYQLIGAYDGQQITLECHSQAYPKSINYWTKDNGEIIPHSNKFVPEILDHGYKVHMKLTINFLTMGDYGLYKCISKNSLGDMEGSINVYKIPNQNKMMTGKNKSTSLNDITYRIDNGKEDHAGLLLREEEHLNKSHQFYSSGSKQLVIFLLWLYVLSGYITFL